jgi:feruloyl esterase
MSIFRATFNATSTDLSALKNRGGKIIHYHGWADPQASALMSIAYYDGVVKAMGREQTHDFYRLFLIPGMFHCRGGIGCDNVDWLGAITAWVERAIAPAGLVGSRIESGQVTRTLPVCEFPQVAVYKDTGDLNSADNFVCSDRPPTKR